MNCCFYLFFYWSFVSKRIYSFSSLHDVDECAREIYFSSQRFLRNVCKQSFCKRFLEYVVISESMTRKMSSNWDTNDTETKKRQTKQKKKFDSKISQKISQKMQWSKFLITRLNSFWRFRFHFVVVYIKSMQSLESIRTKTKLTRFRDN